MMSGDVAYRMALPNERSVAQLASQKACQVEQAQDQKT